MSPIETKPLSQEQAREALNTVRNLLMTLIAAQTKANAVHLLDGLSDARTVYILDCLSCAVSAAASLELEFRPMAGSRELPATIPRRPKAVTPKETPIARNTPRPQPWIPPSEHPYDRKGPKR